MGLAFLVMPQPDARFSSQRSATSTVQQRLTARPVLASPDRVSAPDECVARDGAPQATFADARFFGSFGKRSRSILESTSPIIEKIQKKLTTKKPRPARLSVSRTHHGPPRQSARAQRANGTVCLEHSVHAMDAMDDDGGLAVVRPTRWKTRDDHPVKENADPSGATGGKLSLGSRDDDADDDDVNMDDVSREWDERVVREDDAAFDQLLDLAEGAMHSVRLKASPAKADDRRDDDDDDDDEGSEYDDDDDDGSEYDEYDVDDDRTADMQHDASVATQENSDVSESSSFDFHVDEPDEDEPGDAGTTTARPTASPARRRAPPRRETRATYGHLASGQTRVSASRTDPSAADAKAWLSEFAALNAKQRAAETALVGTLGADKIADEFAAERETLRRDLFARLERVRGGVRALAGHVADVRGGEAYVLELGRLMDGAERDVVALKEAQKAAYDRLAREERDLARHCDDFASRLETWDADTSDPVWAGVLRDGSGKFGTNKGGRGRRVYGAPTPDKAEPWSRGASASRRKAGALEPVSGSVRPASARTAKTSTSSSADVSKKPRGPSAPARGRERRVRAVQRPPLALSPCRPAGARAASPPPRRRRRRRRRGASPLPRRWRSTTRFSRSTARRAGGRMWTTRGGAGAWRAATCTTRRRRRWRRTTWRPSASSAPRWCATRAGTPSANTSSGRRRRLCAPGARRRRRRRRRRATRWTPRLRASRRSSGRRLRRRLQRLASARRRRCASGSSRSRSGTRRSGGRSARRRRRRRRRRRSVGDRLRIERAERDKRNAQRALEREELREAARVAAEAAAEALIPSAPKMSAAEARAERDRLAARALEGATRKREAATAKKRELEERALRQKTLAAKAREKQRIAEGKTLASLEDPGRLTRATASHALRVASERDAGGLFSAAPAVQYLSHKATPSWRATR
jgi:hypothetical protein